MSDSQTVEDVVARMLAIDDALDARDGVAVFNHVYLRVTQLVQDRLSGGTFHDDAFMAELDVRFAKLWFAAHDAPPSDVPHAWEPLFERRTSAGLLPIQFALAGMNAHIEHDLPLAVVATCAARGRKPTSPGVRDDYEKVNDLLAEIEAEIRRSFLSEAAQAADDSPRPGRPPRELLEHRQGPGRRVGQHQHAVGAATHDVLRKAYEAGLARTVGMGSRLLLTPLL